MIDSELRDSRQVVKIDKQATLAQLVERLIRNLPLPSYAIGSKVGQRPVSLVYSAWRALFEPDSEPGFVLEVR